MERPSATLVEVPPAQARPPGGLLDALPVLLGAVDGDGRITYANGGHEAWLGLAPAKLAGQPLREVLGPRWSDVAPHVERVKAGHKVQFEHQLPGVEGLRWVRCEYVPIPGAPGSFGYVGVDVTAQKAAEARTEAVKAELEDFVENGVLAMHWVGPDGRILWANRAELDMLGYTKQEYVGKPVAEVHADAPAIADILARLQRNETIVNQEARLLAKDGSIRHVLISSNVRRQEGRFAHTRCFTRDITARRQAQLEREAVEARLRVREAQQAAVARLGERALAGTSIEPVLDEATRLVAQVLQLDTCGVLRLDEGATELHLVAGTGFATGVVGNLTLPATQATIAGHTLMVGRAVVVDDLQNDPRFPASSMLRAQGLVSGISVPIPGEGARAWGVIGAQSRRPKAFSADDTSFLHSIANVLGAAAQREAALDKVTQSEERVRQRERQQASVAALGQKALASTPLEELYQATAETIAVTLGHEFSAVLQCSGDQQVTMVGVTGWPRSALGKAIDGIGPHTMVGYTIHRAQGIVMEDLATETRFQGHPRLREFGIVGGMAVPVVAPGGALWGVVTTYTRRRVEHTRDDLHFLQSIANVLAAAIDRDRAEQQLRRANEELRGLDRRKGELINLIAHELRTPLTPVMMRLQLLRLAPAPGQERHLDVLERGLARLGTLVEQLLEVARHDAGTLAARPVQADLVPVVQEAAGLFEQAARQKGVALRVELPARLEGRFDPDRLLQVLVNLISNACKFSEAGGFVEVRAIQDRDRLVVQVRDGGAGFSQAQHGDLFKRFSQPHGPERGGYGLGLHICRIFVAEHGGSIAAESAGPGTGARFTFWIPVAGPASQASASPTGQALAQAPLSDH